VVVFGTVEGGLMEGFIVAWWMWCVFGMLLLISEMATPGAFYQFFFGLGAIAVGLITVVGLEMSLPLQTLLFVVLSIGSIALLRNPLRARFAQGPDEEVDKILGAIAVAVDMIPADAIGKAELRGAQWNARNVSGSTIAKSQRCRVVKLDGLTLEIQGEINQKVGG
jgi:membrane protein implicated in regulation of membrane protease activity